MKKLLIVACLSVMALSQAYAQDVSSKTGKPLTAQQEKMKTCNASAKTQGLKGADRKSFMKTCLSKNGGAAAASAAAPAAAAAAPAAASSAKANQKAKMKTCNADAKTQKLKGKDRKAFMKSCLSGSAAAAPAAP